MVLTRFRAFLAMVCLVLMPFISLGQPVNDNFTNRTVLSGTSISFTGSLGGATLEQYDLQWSPGGTGSRTVWWSWVCESNGPVTMSCEGGSFLVGNNNGLIVWHANHEYTDLESAVPISPVLVLPLRTCYLVSAGTFLAVKGDRYEIELVGSSPISAIPLRLEATNNPVIFEQPKAQRAGVGRSVLFFVSAAGIRPIMYQWMKDGVPLAGEKAALLALTNVTAQDAGSYSVIVSNSTGVTQSDTASLAIGEPVAASMTIDADGPVAFTATLFGQSGASYRLESSVDLGTWIPEPLFSIGLTSYPHAPTSIKFFERNSVSAILVNDAQAKFYRARVYIPANDECDLHLKMIRLGKEFWGRENNRDPFDTATDRDWVPYLPHQQKPTCPLGGVYYVNDLRTLPYCTVAGHMLQEPR